MLSIIAFTLVSLVAFTVLISLPLGIVIGRAARDDGPKPPVRATCVSGSPVDDDGICAAHGESACVMGRAA